MSQLISEKDVTDVLLCQILDEAAVEYRLDEDGDIYVTDLEFPFWIRFMEGRKFLDFSTYIGAKRDGVASRLVELANACNETVFLLSAHYDRETGRLYGQYVMPYQYGLVREHFLLVARRFGGSFRSVVSTMDPDGLLSDA